MDSADKVFKLVKAKVMNGGYVFQLLEKAGLPRAGNLRKNFFYSRPQNYNVSADKLEMDNFYPAQEEMQRIVIGNS